MNIKEIISDYRKKRRRAALLLEKYDELKDRATTPASACNYGEIKTKSSSGREHLYIKMLTAREKWQNAALDELEARQRLFDFVMMLEDPDEMDILYLHFIDGHTIKNIFKHWAGDVSEREIYRKLKSGLFHLEAIAAEKEPE